MERRGTALADGAGQADGETPSNTVRRRTVKDITGLPRSRVNRVGGRLTGLATAGCLRGTLRAGDRFERRLDAAGSLAVSKLVVGLSVVEMLIRGVMNSSKAVQSF